MNCKVFSKISWHRPGGVLLVKRTRKRLSPSSRNGRSFQGSAWANNAIGQMVTLNFAYEPARRPARR